MSASAKWQDVTLGDVLTLKRGYDLPQRERRTGDVPIISSSGVTDFHDTIKVRGPGVVTGRYGTLGEIFYVESDYWPLNTSLYVQNFKGNHPRFISYFLQTLNFVTQNVAGAVPGVNRNVLHMMPVKLPPLETQQQIAAILSAYDDLIENNSRRIKVLEEMAGLIYREWFVNFRFPGHEGVRLVASELGEIPEGWSVNTFSNLFDIRYGKNLPKSKILEEGPYPVYGAGGIIGYHDKPLQMDKVALITCRGNGSGKVWRTKSSAFITNNSLMLLPSKEFDYLKFHFIGQLASHSNVNGVISGSAQPQITIDGLSSVNAVVSPKNLAEQFNNVADGLYEQMDILDAKNHNLRRTRDVLLPKLISGELSVSQLGELPETGQAA